MQRAAHRHFLWLPPITNLTYLMRFGDTNLWLTEPQPRPAHPSHRPTPTPLHPSTSPFLRQSIAWCVAMIAHGSYTDSPAEYDEMYCGMYCGIRCTVGCTVGCTVLGSPIWNCREKPNTPTILNAGAPDGTPPTRVHTFCLSLDKMPKRLCPGDDGNCGKHASYGTKGMCFMQAVEQLSFGVGGYNRERIVC